MAGMKFTATIHQEGEAATGIPVPPETRQRRVDKAPETLRNG
jgi:hypothetical protein